MKLSPEQSWIGVPIAFLGALLSLVWLLVQGKMSAYERYWNDGLKELGRVLGFEMFSEKRYVEYKKGTRLSEEQKRWPNRLSKWFFSSVDAGFWALSFPAAFFVAWLYIGLVASGVIRLLDC
jgi:hypothetical protein